MIKIKIGQDIQAHVIQKSSKLFFEEMPNTQYLKKIALTLKVLFHENLSKKSCDEKRQLTNSKTPKAILNSALTIAPLLAFIMGRMVHRLIFTAEIWDEAKYNH